MVSVYDYLLLKRPWEIQSCRFLIDDLTKKSVKVLFLRFSDRLYNAYPAVWLPLVEADNETFLEHVAGLHKSFCRLNRVLLECVQKVVGGLSQGRGDYFGYDVAETGTIPALMRGGKEDEHAGRFDD